MTTNYLAADVWTEKKDKNMISKAEVGYSNVVVIFYWARQVEEGGLTRCNTDLTLSVLT